jgi:hypothetical protein
LAHVHTWRGSAWPEAYGGALATCISGSPMTASADRGTGRVSAVVKLRRNIHGPAHTCTRLRLGLGQTVVAWPRMHPRSLRCGHNGSVIRRWRRL